MAMLPRGFTHNKQKGVTEGKSNQQPAARGISLSGT